MEQRFCDGVEEVSITSGIVRIDFFSYGQGPKDKEGRPAREFSHRVLLSPEAFVHTYSALEQVVKQLQEKGLLQRRDGANGASKSPAAAMGGAKAPAAAPMKGKSPNF